MKGEDQVHRPVLLGEVLAGLNLPADGRVIDGTFGRGGHSRAILRLLGPAGKLLALDRDPDALASVEAARLRTDPRFELEYGPFSGMRGFVEQRGWIGRVSGILLDLGVSSPQLDNPERGFSFSRSGPLDMRMDPGTGVPAAEWLESVTEAELANVLRDYGEERYARRIASAVVSARKSGVLATTEGLARVIERVVPSREPGKHPATRSFQAIRIVLNQELSELDAVLEQAAEILAPGGRLVVIAFHSLEDRVVKRFVREAERGGKPVPRGLPVEMQRTGTLRRIGKAVKPTAEEVLANPRARSAIMRVAERTP